MFSRSCLALIAASILLSGCATSEPAHTRTLSSEVRLTLSVRGGQTDSHNIQVVVEIANRSRRTIYVFGYPTACAVPGGNPALLVLDDRGHVIDPPTWTGASCPYPPQYPIAPGGTVRRTIAVDLKGAWLKAKVILAERTGLQHLVETRRLRVAFAFDG